MESDVLQIFLSIFTEVKFGVGDRIGRYSSVIYSENSIEPIALNRIQSDKFPVGQELYTDWIEKNRVWAVACKFKRYRTVSVARINEHGCLNDREAHPSECASSLDKKPEPFAN